MHVRFDAAKYAPFGIVYFALLLSACGGGANSSTVAPVALAAQPDTAQSVASSAKIVLTIPASTSTAADTRSPRFVSAGTNGIAVSVKLHSSQAVIASGASDVSSTSASCTKTSGGGRTCTVVIPAAPTRASDSDDVTVTSFDTRPINGAIPTSAKQLATATDVDQVITAGKSSTLYFTLEGTPAAISFSNTRSSVLGDQGAQRVSDPVTVLDASGQVIIGEFSSPVALSVNDTGAHTRLASGAATAAQTLSLASSSDAAGVEFSYDGLAPADYDATISPPSGINGASAILATLTVSSSTKPAVYFPGGSPSIVFTAVNQSLDLDVSEAGFGGTFSSANTCEGSNFVIPSQPQGSAQDEIFPISVGAGGSPACSLTIGDGSITYPAISVSLGPTTTITVPTPTQTATPVITISPNPVNFLGMFDAQSHRLLQAISVSEQNYSGMFTPDSSSSCFTTQPSSGQPIAQLVNGITSGLNFVVTPYTAGKCTILFRDSAGIAGSLAVNVTTTTLGGQ